MNARRALLDGENLTLKNWLRRRLRGEAFSQFAEALVFFAIGLVAIAALAFVPVCALFLNFGLDGTPELWLAAAATYVVLAQFAIVGARLTESSNNLAWQILFSGGTQLLTSAQALRKSFRAWRLARRDIEQVAEIVLWVFKQGRKARTREICAALPDVNVVRILPQLKEMPGVIWLTHRDEVIILSRVLRQELANLLKMIPTPTPEPEEEPAYEAREEPRSEAAKSEVVGWYQALDLPPFSTVEKVKRRYRELVKIHHPDTRHDQNTGAARKSEERIREINAAYHNILRNSAAPQGVTR